MLNFSTYRLGLVVLATGLFLANFVGASDDRDAWLESIRESWAEEDNEFKHGSTSPLAGVLRFEIGETRDVYFAMQDGQVGWSLEQQDQAAFSLINSEEQWKWTGLQNEVVLTRGDEDLSSGSTLAAGDRTMLERFTIQFYPSADSVTALVFDPETQRIKEFKTLDRFEANPKFAVTAKIVRFETPEQLELVTALQRYKKQYRYARLQFEIDGEALELTAYKHALEGEGSDVMFIPFTDKTKGKYTYGGGRYLFSKEPPEGNDVLIDFNLVINPLCSYAAIYNCIVPTRENRLPIEILAGVKKYDYPELD